ncbi:MAG: PAS domain-containing protein, partial [Deltaproteobacteria bacterium]|nr:PAS domain-containing protein [Deltaproteobacteria bacterium]
AGNAALGGGCLLLALRGVVSPFLSIVVANTLVALAYVLLLNGTRQFAGKPREWWLSAVLVGGVCLGLSVLVAIEAPIDWRITLNVLMPSLLSFRLCRLLSRLEEPATAFARKVTAQVFMVNAFGYMATGLLAAPPYEEFSDLFAPSRLMVFMFPGALLCVIGWSVGFLFMVDQRSRAELEDSRRELEDKVAARTEALERQIAERAQAEHALQDREARLRRAESLARIGHYSFDVDLGNGMGSEGLEKIWGVAPGTHRTFADYVQHIHAEDQPRIMAVVSEAVRHMRGFDLEYRVVRLDGKVVTVHSVAEVTVDTQGKLARFFGALIDISEQKKIEQQLRDALNERETLLREIHHRVKNNLQVIASLLYLQARRTDSLESQHVLQESRDRIVAMSLIHQKLYRSTNLSRINFTDYARDLVTTLFRSYGVTTARVSLVIPDSDMTLAINQAVSCGIIINEVVSNALKYAFPHDRHGTLFIECQQDPHHRYHLILRDDGVGLPADFETRSQLSLGITLIKRLTEQLHGTLNYSSSAQGTVYHLTFTHPMRREEDDTRVQMDEAYTL